MSVQLHGRFIISMLNVVEKCLLTVFMVADAWVFSSCPGSCAGAQSLPGQHEGEASEHAVVCLQQVGVSAAHVSICCIPHCLLILLGTTLLQ